MMGKVFLLKRRKPKRFLVLGCIVGSCFFDVFFYVGNPFCDEWVLFIVCVLPSFKVNDAVSVLFEQLFCTQHFWHLSRPKFLF